MKRFLEVLWFYVFWIQHTKVSMLLVYMWHFLLCVFKTHIVELVIYVVNRNMIVWRIQFLEWSDDFFVFVFMMILFYLIFLFL